MKKRYLIIIIVQGVLLVMMFIYAFIQKLEANKNLMEAVRQEKIAKEVVMQERKLSDSLRLEIKQLREQKGQ